tara:strand:+ start:5304 stop:5552 length:249 start_codon:yes stop_codon:yes gene_type:complete
MPTYDYACDSCGNIFEKQLPISQRKVPEGRCIECNNGDVRQIIGVPLFAYDNVHTRKVDDGFRDRLKEIKRSHPGASMNIPH